MRIVIEEVRNYGKIVFNKILLKLAGGEGASRAFAPVKKAFAYSIKQNQQKLEFHPKHYFFLLQFNAPLGEFIQSTK